MDDPLLALRVLIRRNVSQILFIFAAFFLMVLLGSFLLNRMLRSHLIDGAQAALSTAEANVRSSLAEADTTLRNSYHVTQIMLRDGADQGELGDYLRGTSAWMQEREGPLGFYGIYGYIRGEFFDTIGLAAGREEYVPQRQPWFHRAIQNRGSMTYATPRLDRDGSSILTVARYLDTLDGLPAGVLALDINIDWLNEYIRSLSLVPGGHGLTLTQDLVMMNHPDPQYRGQFLQALGGGFPGLAQKLMVQQDVTGEVIRDREGVKQIVFFRKLFNNWYVGLITPYWRFFRDMIYAAVALSQLGILLTFALSAVLLRINAAKMKSDEENRQKSTFLAQMSHEIRTPMNAIIGISEITLREEISPKVTENITAIKNAGNNLLAIINDILDFSRIESGKLELVPTEYSFSSLINDCISIVRTRLVDRPVHFFTKIDRMLPVRLYGDEVRLRQILLNLLGNAVKYTNEGHITFTVKSETEARPSVGDSINLVFEVADTGIGIRAENMGKLFGQFNRFAENELQHTEGTGLGLAITKSLCLLMGGDISAESEYCVGSVFRVVLPQMVKDPAPLAEVEEPETKPTLIYETRKEYADAITYSVSNLGISAVLVETPADFVNELVNRSYSFILTGSVSFKGAHEMLRSIAPPRNAGALLVLMADYGEETERQGVKTFFMPIQPQPLAQLFNRGPESRQDTAERQSAGVRFIAPDCSILVVDDVYSNLVVAEGLLAPYKVRVDSCLSGERAIALVKQHSYDIVFMDHMMPVMDGIEAAQRIRALPLHYAATMPIVALTANAISGMKEMFLENGFTDYLSKPIDLAKLDGILTQWLPRDKCHRVSPAEALKAGAPEQKGPSAALVLLGSMGVNIEKGMTLTGGAEREYRKVLAAFYRDLMERRELFQEFSEAAGQGSFSPERLNLFTVSVHALKSASGTIGAEEVSREAAELEAAGRAGDLAAIAERLPPFRRHLDDLTDTLRIALGLDRNSGPAESGVQAAEREEFRPLFEDLRRALEGERINEIDRALNAFEERSLGPEMAKLVADISDHVLISNFEEALEAVKDFLA